MAPGGAPPRPHAVQALWELRDPAGPTCPLLSHRFQRQVPSSLGLSCVSANLPLPADPPTPRPPAQRPSLEPGRLRLSGQSYPPGDVICSFSNTMQPMRLPETQEAHSTAGERGGTGEAQAVGPTLQACLRRRRARILSLSSAPQRAPPVTWGRGGGLGLALFSPRMHEGLGGSRPKATPFLQQPLEVPHPELRRGRMEFSKAMF